MERYLTLPPTGFAGALRLRAYTSLHLSGCSLKTLITLAPVIPLAPATRTECFSPSSGYAGSPWKTPEDLTT